MNENWTFNDVDRALAEEMQAFLPAKMFDTHAHIYRTADLTIARPYMAYDGPAVGGIDAWRQHIGRQTGVERLAGGLFIPIQLTKPMEVHNDFVVSELKNAPDSRGLIMIDQYSSSRPPMRMFDVQCGMANVHCSTHIHHSTSPSSCVSPLASFPSARGCARR